MHKLFQKVTGKNVKELRRELANAHLIIALLSLTLIAMLAMGASQPIYLDETLTAISIGLLTLVTIISLCVSITMFRKK
jgi:hypothetical protein